MNRQIAITVFAVCLSSATIAAYAASLTLSPAVQRVEANAGLRGVVSSIGGSSVRIDLSSSNPGAASVPAFVTSNSALGANFFDIDVNSVTSDTQVTITASIPSTKQPAIVSVSFTVLAPPQLLPRIDFSPTPVVAVQPATATFTINRAAGHGGVLLTLGSLNTPVATLPPTATVPAGSASVSVPITTKEVNVESHASLHGALSDGVRRAAESLTVQPSPMEITSLTVATPIVSGQPQKSGTVTLNHGATADATVTLSSSHPNVTVPNSIVIRKGSATGNYSISASNIPAGTPSDTAEVSATLGRSTRSAKTTVEGTLVLVSSITHPQAQITSGKSFTFTVNLNVTASQNAIVSLGSNSANLKVPDSVIVKGGQRAAGFEVNAIGMATGAPNQPATITASLGGESVTIPTTIHSPRPTIVSVTVPSPIISDAPAQPAQVVLSETSLRDETVRVGTNSGNLQLSGDFIIPAGQTTGTFQVSGRGLGQGSGQSVTAELNVTLGIIKTASVTINAPVAAFAISSFTVAPERVVGGTPVTGTVTLSAPAPSSGETVFLSVSEDREVVTAPSSFTIPGGQTSGTFDITTTRPVPPAENGTATISARIGAQAAVRTTCHVASPRLSRVFFTPDIVQMATAIGATRGQVELSIAAPPGGVRVHLDCTATSPEIPCDSRYTSPSGFQVTVAAGQVSAPFSIESVPSENPSQPVTSTWSYRATSPDANGEPSGSVTIKQVFPASLTLSSSSVRGGDPLTATLRLSEPAISARSVNLIAFGRAHLCESGVNPSSWHPGNISIPAGQQTGTFTIATEPPSCDVTYELKASTNSAFTNVLFNVVSARVVSVSASPATIVGGEPFSVVITIDNTVPSGSSSSFLNLAKFDPESVLTMPLGALAMPAGQTTVTFNGTSRAVSTIKTITIEAFRQNQQPRVGTTLTVNPQ